MAATAAAVERLFNRPVMVIVVLASLVVALLHGLGGGAGGEGWARASAVPAGEPAPARSVAAQTPAVPASAPRRPGASQATLRAAPASPPRRAALREAFERADDLYVFVQSLLPAAAAGDADALWMTSRVYDYCAAHAMDPGAFARDTGALARMGPGAAGPLVRARGRVAERCRQFVPGDGLGRELVIVQRLKAAGAGSLPAEAALLAMGEPLEDDADYRRDLVQRVQDSADPEAFSALAPAMGLAASGDEAHAGQVAGTSAAELAWQVGACELGLDCTPQGALMTSLCANGGICSRDEHQDFQAFVKDADLPPGEEEAIDELTGSLLGEGVPR